MTVSCAAVICVRNEFAHIRRTIRDFLSQGIEVIVIDHESTDGTREYCRDLLGRGVLKLIHLPWEGEFGLTKQLETKKEITESLSHDWVIHADADEWLQSPVPHESLLDGINRQSKSGFNVINFEEFVFLPHREQLPVDTNYQEGILTYYFFEPHTKRLMRAWKRSFNFQNIHSGGHRLEGADLNLSPENFLLRHYLVLSQKHAITKYVGRVFGKRDLAKKMHGNRLNLSAENLHLPQRSDLEVLETWDSKDFDRSNPRREHFWKW